MDQTNNSPGRKFKILAVVGLVVSLPVTILGFLATFGNFFLTGSLTASSFSPLFALMTMGPPFIYIAGLYGLHKRATWAKAVIWIAVGLTVYGSLNPFAIGAIIGLLLNPGQYFSIFFS